MNPDSIIPSRWYSCCPQTSLYVDVNYKNVHLHRTPPSAGSRNVISKQCSNELKSDSSLFSPRSQESCPMPAVDSAPATLVLI